MTTSLFEKLVQLENHRTMTETLTRCQAECTRLLEENRKLKEQLFQQESASKSAPKPTTPYARSVEDQNSISEWANNTFGVPASNMQIAIRANMEMAELLRSCQQGAASCDVVEEAADIIIVLTRLFWRHGFDMHQEIDRKMAINRQRTWSLDSKGNYVRQK